ncbi:MAG TPA: hypothetical protein VE398_20045 [Acidobacteriota bacterium]|nr:hypothetical protein [Acidobacteriota bacterium]
MKRRFISLMLVVSLGLVSWGTAQSGSSAPFDVRKCQQELEIMRGILSTTLGFVANDIKGRQVIASAGGKRETVLANSWWSPNVSGYYLHGQGAVFVVPMSALRGHAGWLLGSEHDGDYQVFSAQMEAAEAKLAQSEAMLEALSQPTLPGGGVGVGVGSGTGSSVAGGVVGGVPGGVSGGVVGGVPGGVPSPAAVQATPAPAPTPKAAKPLANQDEIRRRLLEAQERVKQHREQSDAERQKLIEAVAQAKVYLIEALANHGDSLATVRPNEYLNLIITTDDGGLFFAGADEPRARRQIISVQKSVITDYKAGRLSLDAFKQKVLQYEE